MTFFFQLSYVNKKKVEKVLNCRGLSELQAFEYIVDVVFVDVNTHTVSKVLCHKI